jgi:two-component system CheB/CheR fusion protein
LLINKRETAYPLPYFIPQNQYFTFIKSQKFNYNSNDWGQINKSSKPQLINYIWFNYCASITEIFLSPKPLSMPSTEPDYIIAIGASAGGLEEINTFFDHTPLDGVAYVIVQHLSAEFKSRMVELLAKHSKLKVEEAIEGTPVQTNHVYLIPNDKFMSVKNGNLHLTNKENISGPHLTINRFFNSLAVNSGKKAIGIILSGLGSDGTEGIKTIKKAGGMVMVRNPETSEFSSMPSNAINTGMVDFVLEPELMPNAIEDFVKYAGKSEIENQYDEKSLINIINLIKEKMPLDFSDYKQSTILRRTNRRASYGNFTSLDKYLNHLKVTPGEVEALAQDFLISVTSFFRDEGAFDYIKIRYYQTF